MHPIDFGGQRSKVKGQGHTGHLWKRACEHNRDLTVVDFFIRLGKHVNRDERMNPIDFGGQRSKLKVTMDIFGNKLVNTIET